MMVATSQMPPIQTTLCHIVLFTILRFYDSRCLGFALGFIKSCSSMQTSDEAAWVAPVTICAFCLGL